MCSSDLFGSCAFRNLHDDIQPALREMKVAIQELDSRNGISKQSRCSATQYVDLLIGRPSLQLMPPCKLGEFVFEE